MPAGERRMLAKLRELAADALVLDLEDGVAPRGKDAARANLREAYAEGRLALEIPWLLRINPPSMPEHEDDLALAEALRPAGIVLPKAEDPEHVIVLARRLEGLGIATALGLETARGVGRARDLATCHSAVRMLIYGAADLRLSLGARPDPDRAWERHAMGEILLAARMQRAAAIDGVYFRYRDLEGLARHAGIARDLGYDGKSCIHPCQIEPIHAAFAPTPDEIAWASRILTAWRAEGGSELGVIVVEGEMIESLHTELARRILARAARTHGPIA